MVSDRSEQQSVDERDVNRRALLRRGGVIVAATVAGATAVEAMSGGSARAASGDALTLGQANTSGTNPASVTSTATTASVSLANTADHAPLVLASQTGDSYDPAAGGELVNLDGFLYSSSDTEFGVDAGFVYTELTANQVVTIIPQRVLDTRSASGRANIVGGPSNSNLFPDGRLIGGRSIIVALGDFAFEVEGVFGNLVAVAPVNAGYMTLYPDEPRPETSSIDCAKGQTIANFVVSGMSVNDTVSIYSSVTTHVLLDITAFNVFNPALVNPDVLPSARAGSANSRLAKRLKQGSTPSWYRGAGSR
jgi:hypothetical protein